MDQYQDGPKKVGPKVYEAMSTEDHFAAQLGTSRSGRLRFTNGAHRVAIRADSYGRSLYRARFEDRMPIVGVRGVIKAFVERLTL